MSINFRPLNDVTHMMEHVGFEVGYAYDDLVFSENAVFIVQFGDSETKELKLFLNVDCEKKEVQRIEKGMKVVASDKGYVVIPSGTFELSQKDGADEIDIRFYN